ncbi:VOC family protein [Erythrobacteraceae bacterium E2-1 Yellow Sea]|nr:VOC family protein [Erythrobacteraceae bacterium E2-1 Yellow Sea]
MTYRRHTALAAFSALALLVVPIAQAQDTAEPAPERETLGLNHIGLAVSDLGATVAFFTDTLGWETAGGDPDYPSIFVTNGEMFVTLWRVTDPATATPFNRKTNVGLHHMAITVRDLTTLHELHRRFVAHPGVVIEFAPEFLGNGPTTHMMIREPSGLRLEFIVPRGRMSAEEQKLPNPRSRN